MSYELLIYFSRGDYRQEISEHTRVSSDPDIKSEPFEFQAIAFTQP